MKHFFKSILYRFPFLRYPFIWFYHVGWKKPFSPGYSFEKFALIKDVVVNRLDMFQNRPLPLGYGIGFDERVVEYPWFFSRLKPHEKKLLDAGSSLNHPDILNLPTLYGRSLDIVTLADEGRWRAKNPIAYSYQDLRHLDFKDESFDVVVCLSTLEHVGMDNTFLYTSNDTKKENDPKGYLTAVRESRRVLKKGGTLYVTVPFGKHKNHEWFQIFDATMVQNLVDVFSPSRREIVFFKYQRTGWDFSSMDECQAGEYVDVRRSLSAPQQRAVAAECVVCLALSH